MKPSWQSSLHLLALPWIPHFKDPKEMVYSFLEGFGGIRMREDFNKWRAVELNDIQFLSPILARIPSYPEDWHLPVSPAEDYQAEGSSTVEQGGYHFVLYLENGFRVVSVYPSFTEYCAGGVRIRVFRNHAETESLKPLAESLVRLFQTANTPEDLPLFSEQGKITRIRIPYQRGLSLGHFDGEDDKDLDTAMAAVYTKFGIPHMCTDTGVKVL